MLDTRHHCIRMGVATEDSQRAVGMTAVQQSLIRWRSMPHSYY